MPETTSLGKFLGCQATAGLTGLFQADRFQPGTSGVGLQDQAVVAATQEDAIICLGHSIAFPVPPTPARSHPGLAHRVPTRWYTPLEAKSQNRPCRLEGHESHSGVWSITKTYLTLQGTEQALVNAASTIYAGYIQDGRVSEGDEAAWMKRSIDEALAIAKQIEDLTVAESEMD